MNPHPTSGRDVVIAPSTRDYYDRYHYASAVRAGGLLFCSGVIGSDSAGRVPSDPEEQFTLAFVALGDVLRAAGCSFDDVAEITTYHVGYPRDLKAFMAIKDRFLTEPWPAWTAVGVASLSRPEVRVEIRATAVLPSESRGT